MLYEIKNMIRFLSKKNSVMERIYSIANYIKVHILKEISDESFARMKYKENTGKVLNLENPITYNEKLWWLKVNNRDPLMTKCSDKYLVRDYVKDCGLGHILNELYGVYDNANDIDFESLPVDEVFLKCNHGSGKNIIYRKNINFNKSAFIKEFNKSLKQNYFLQSREWNYKDISPKIISERVLRDKDGNLPNDYKFMCFDGEPKLLIYSENVCLENGKHNSSTERFTNVYDMEFNLLPVTILFRNDTSVKIEKPTNFEKMIEYARILSKPFVQCRIDFYNILQSTLDGYVYNIYLGEITFYHGGACHNISPDEWAFKMGSWIDLNSHKIVRKNGND